MRYVSIRVLMNVMRAYEVGAMEAQLFLSSTADEYTFSNGRKYKRSSPASYQEYLSTIKSRCQG